MNPRCLCTLLLLAVSSFGGEDQASQRLAKTKMFAFGGVGIAGITSEGEAAFRTVMASPNAKAEFLRLLKTGNPQAQCYALVGLHLVDPAAFNAESARFSGSTKEVQTAAGCILGKQSLGGLVASIRAGNYDQQAKLEIKR